MGLKPTPCPDKGTKREHLDSMIFCGDPGDTGFDVTQTS